MAVGFDKHLDTNLSKSLIIFINSQLKNAAGFA